MLDRLSSIEMLSMKITELNDRHLQGCSMMYRKRPADSCEAATQMICGSRLQK
jgi:hypothetical protein